MISWNMKRKEPGRWATTFDFNGNESEVISG